jgi:hypothetical protein
MIVIGQSIPYQHSTGDTGKHVDKIDNLLGKIRPRDLPNKVKNTKRIQLYGLVNSRKCELQNLKGNRALGKTLVQVRG